MFSDQIFSGMILFIQSCETKVTYVINLISLMYINSIINMKIHIYQLLGGGFKYFLIFTPKIGEDYHFDEHIVQMGGSTTT